MFTSGVLLLLLSQRPGPHHVKHTEHLFYGWIRLNGIYQCTGPVNGVQANTVHLGDSNNCKLNFMVK